MSAPVHRTSERPSAAALAAARQRREEGRSGSSAGSAGSSGSSGSSGTSAELALLGLQSSAGNQAATATVQRARGRTLERPPGTDTIRPGSAPGPRRAPTGRARAGSAPGALADHAPLDTDPGTRTASDSEARSTTSTPERAATPDATTATRFAPSGRTRRGSESDTRPNPAGPTRRGSETGTQGMEVDTGFQEHIDTARDEARRAAERAAEEARLAAERTAKEAHLAALAARFTPSGRTRRGSDSDTRPDPAGPTRRGSETGTQGMEVDPGFQEHIDTAKDDARRAAEEEARRAAAEEARLAAERTDKEARLAALAASFTPSGRTRRGSDSGTRPDPAGPTRRGSETGIRDMEVDTGFQEHVDTARDDARRAAEEREAEEARLAEERAAAERARLAAERATAEEARIAALVARFTPSGRTRRGSDLGTRPDPTGPTRRGSETGTQGMEVDPGFQEHIDTARDDARRAAEEREAEEARRAAAEANSEARSDRLKAVAENADQGKKLLDPTDALGKGVQAPTAAGLGQEATAMASSAPKNDTAAAADASALKHDASAAGVSGASVSALTEILALGASVADSFRNLKTSLRKRTGAGHHNARKKAKTKATDAGVSVTSTGANAGAVAKDAVKLQGVANTASAAEASGILSAVAGLAKSIRAMGKVGGATSKYRKLRKLGDAGVVHAELLDGLQTQANTAERDAATAYAAITALETELNGGRARAELNDALTAAVTAYEAAALLEAQAKVAYFSALRDVDTLAETRKLAKKKQVSKGAKEAMGGVVGEGLKGAGGIATATIVATGALASNPAGWIIAGVGAGLVLTVAGYKGGRAATKRFQEAHHPERYTPDGEETPVAQPTWESLKHAMKVWKKVSRHKRQLAAHKIYNMASSPDTAPDLRRSALDLLVAIKCGPEKHKMEQGPWEASLMDPAGKADWIKEITDQLSSGS